MEQKVKYKDILQLCSDVAKKGIIDGEDRTVIKTVCSYSSQKYRHCEEIGIEEWGCATNPKCRNVRSFYAKLKNGEYVFFSYTIIVNLSWREIARDLYE